MLINLLPFGWLFVYISYMNRLLLLKWIKSDILLLFLTTLVAGGLRFYKIAELPCGLFPDQALHGLDALRFAHGVLSPVYHGNEGLFVYLVAISHFFFGTGIWQIFIVSAFIGTLTVFTVFLFVREVFGRNIAFFTSFFLAVSPWHIALSRNGFRAILVPFFISLTFFFFFKALHSYQSKKRSAFFALSSLSFALGFYTYYAYLVFPFVLFLLFLFFLFFHKERLLAFYQKNRTPLIESVVLFGVVIFPLFLYIAILPSRYFARIHDVSALSDSYAFFDNIQYVLFHFFETLKGIFTHGDPNWRHNAGNNPFLSFYLLPFFLFGFFMSLFRKGFSRTLSLFFLAMILPAALSREGFTPHGLRLIGIIPFLYVFPALSLSWIFHFVQSKMYLGVLLLLKFFVGLFFIFLTLQGYNHYFRDAPLDKEYYNAFRCDLTEVAQYIQSHKAENIELIVDDYSYFTLKYLFYPRVIFYHSPESFFHFLQSGKISPGRTFLIAISYGDTYWKIKKSLDKEHTGQVILNLYGEPAFYLFAT